MLRSICIPNKNTVAQMVLIMNSKTRAGASVMDVVAPTNEWTEHCTPTSCDNDYILN